MKISFYSYVKKAHNHMKSFALSLAFIMRFNATRKWPAVSSPVDENELQLEKLVIYMMFSFRDALGGISCLSKGIWYSFDQ